jgi:hypothetical protein
MTPGSTKNKRLATLCILGWVLFNYPILSLLNRDILVFGIPVLYVFLFLSWGALILFMAVVTMTNPKFSKRDSGEKKRSARERFFEIVRTRGKR